MQIVLTTAHISYESLGKGAKATPLRDYKGPLELIRPYWKDLAPLV